MNLAKTILGAAVAAMFFGAATTSVLASPSPYPTTTLSISGTLYYTPQSGDKVQGVPLKKVSYNTKSLIKLLNASAYATNLIHQVTGTSQIPSGSYFLFDLWNETLAITNKNGFYFPLESNSPSYDLGYMEIDEYGLIGTYKLKTDSSGTETDKTGIYFYFYDGADNENEIELYGTATLKWTYGAVKSDGTQKATLSVTMSGNSNDDSYVNDYDAIPASFSASGSGSFANEATNAVPFFYEW